MLSAENQAKAQILAACLIWGAFFPVWKVLLSEVPPQIVLALYSPIVPLLLWCFYRMPLRELRTVLVSHFPLLAGIALCGGVLGAYLIFYSISKLDSGVAAVVLHLQPFFTIVFARIFLNEQLSERQLLFGAAAIVFTCLVAIEKPLQFAESNVHLLGLLAGIASAISYGLSTVCARALSIRGVEPKFIAFFRMGLASIFLVPAVLLLPVANWDFQFSGRIILLLLLVTVAPGTIAFVIYFRGLQVLQAGLANLLELLTPIIALTLGIIVLGESYSASQLLAVPCFLLCIWQVAR